MNFKSFILKTKTIMGENKTINSLGTKWGNFLKVIFDPWVLLLLIITVIFIYFSSESADPKGTPVDPKTSALLTLIITLIAGLLGGVIANRWAQETELKVLVARGKSAIRSLKLILLNISNIENRTKAYIVRLDPENKEYKLIISDFEEIIEKCNILEEEIISSIENWTDIIPEVANLKTQIGIISDLKLNEDKLEKEISTLTETIQSVQEKESKQTEELKSNLRVKEAELLKAKRDLVTAESKINTSVLSGLSVGVTGPKESLFGINYGTSGLYTVSIPNTISSGPSGIGSNYIPSGVNGPAGIGNTYIPGGINGHLQIYNCKNCGKNFTTELELTAHLCIQDKFDSKVSVK